MSKICNSNKSKKYFRMSRIENSTFFLSLMLFLFAITACEKADNSTIPAVITLGITEIGTDKVLCGGQVNNDGGKSITERGVLIGKSENPLLDGTMIPMGAGMGLFNQWVENLDPGTNYHLCAYAVNETGTAYGEVKAIKTRGIITDIDGNSYSVVDIGNQTWMGENLKTSKYRNGNPIPQVLNDEDWHNLESGAFCYYDNNPSNGLIYGKLYNWYAMMDERGICPEGWEQPDNNDWMELIDFAGGLQNAGASLKQKGFDLWEPPNVDARNSTGFTALPAGVRVRDGFFSIKQIANFWSATEYDEHANWQAYLSSVGYNHSGAYVVPVGKNYGQSVRCIKKGE
jgi:uncharacterized protein (TIGR02145 family)